MTVSPVLSKVRIVVAAAAAVALAGCSMPPTKQTFPALTYAYKGPITFNVANVEVVSTYVPPMTEPNVDQLAPAQPAAVMMQWGRDRLRAGGGTGTLRMTVTDGRIVDTPLPIEGGIRGAFTRQQSDRFTAYVAAEIVITDARGQQVGFVRSNAERSRTIAEGTPPAERDKVLFELTESVINDMDSRLETSIRQTLQRFIQPS
ncbi:MAG TPA: hypothetical protein VL966_08180 [Alphaproteobacteria bacterium]|jgi:hypothetical protein|nr:hypothetical protein [Alphaproteobacteria bacterium]